MCIIVFCQILKSKNRLKRPAQFAKDTNAVRYEIAFSNSLIPI